MNVKSPNNTSKWQMGFNSAFKGLMHFIKAKGFAEFLGAFAKLRKATISLVMSVCLSVRT
jgi:hypothetical protein